MKLVTRSQWGARPPKRRSAISKYVRGVGIHWHGTGIGTFPHTSCDDKVRSIQKFHMYTQGWDDIAYSHLICPHGYVFEGRKWGVRTAANGTNTGNTYYHAVCYLGGQGDPFTAAAKAAFKEYIIRHKSIYGNEVRPHSWFKSTACPGTTIRNWLSSGMPVTSTTSGTTTSSCDSQILKLGSKGTCVKECQNLLIKKGYNLGGWGADGDFGAATDKAVRSFQSSRGLASDGIVGPNTWRALRS